MSGKRGSQFNLSTSPEYITWSCMKARCYDKNHQAYRYYGGKGIQVCKRWKNSFLAFFNDMGRKPASGYQIDRIDSDGDYRLSNCRWVTREEQINNRSNTQMLTWNGVTKSFSDWSRETGISNTLLWARRDKGWPVEKILSYPTETSKQKAKKYLFRGKSLSLTEWSKELGIDRDTLKRRLFYGWSVEKTLGTPLNDRYANRKGKKRQRNYPSVDSR